MHTSLVMKKKEKKNTSAHLDLVKVKRNRRHHKFCDKKHQDSSKIGKVGKNQN